MSMNNSKVWISLASILTLFVAIGGGYFSAQIGFEQRLGDKVSRSELKEAVKDTRDQIQRELNDVKENQKQTNEEIKETNRLLRQLMLKNKGRE